MQDQWYGDKRDLVKWGTLLELSRIYSVHQILQVLYYRSNTWAPILIDEKEFQIDDNVIRHFRKSDTIRNLKSRVTIEVLDKEFSNESRNLYLQYVTSEIQNRKAIRKIVFLDPDTGLEPPSKRYGATHVLENELRAIWESLSDGDVLVFYQHETGKNGKPFIEPKLHQFAKALGIEREQTKYSFAPKITRDVAFFFTQRTIRCASMTRNERALVPSPSVPCNSN